MDDVRPLAAFEHEFQGRAAEKSKALVVISLPVEDVPMKKIMVRVRLDEKTLAPMHKSKIHAAMNCRMIPRHPQVFVTQPHVIDLIVTQAIVLGQNDLDA